MSPVAQGLLGALGLNVLEVLGWGSWAGCAWCKAAWEGILIACCQWKLVALRWAILGVLVYTGSTGSTGLRVLGPLAHTGMGGTGGNRSSVFWGLVWGLDVLG